MKASSESFIAKGGCSIVNFGSIYGIMPPRFDIYDNTCMTMPVEYAAIKAGIIHMSKYFAKYYLKKMLTIRRDYLKKKFG